LSNLLEEASARYRRCGRFDREFARKKLRADPVYTRILAEGWLPDGGTILDLGCGRGLMLALLAAARRHVASGAWPAAWPLPPTSVQLVGIDHRLKATAVAREALGDDARIITADVTAEPLPPSRAVLLFDVLHMIDRPDQEALLRRIRSALEEDGILLLREADASAGWRFRITRLGNRCTALWRRAFRQQFHYRSLDEWTRSLSELGFEVATHSMSAGTPFANVLLRARRRLP
jgi:SAM-dependent methyltransferase